MEHIQMTGAEFRAARKLLGYKTQQDLAVLIDYTRETISRIEKGHDRVTALLADYMLTRLALQKLEEKSKRNCKRAKLKYEKLENKFIRANQGSSASLQSAPH